MIPKLSQMQNEVLKMIAIHGHSNKVIAKELNITEDTVKVHLRTVFKKLDVCNRTQAAAKYVESNSGGWKTIDTIPKEAVLIITNTGFICKAVHDYFPINGHGWCIAWEDYTRNIKLLATHWMPLPQPPEK